MGTDTWHEIRIGTETVEQSAARLFRAHRLIERRESRGLSVGEAASLAGITVDEVSAIERGDAASLPGRVTGAYVGALGGSFEMVADFGGRWVVLD
ncbi:hypothetical protein Afil01_12740 [Actinorhabdospora filicis]|uniref:HTH cro/C1-type domain-containing protein n=1 Tax=Actinorhabdospora filicis TaxID=1785913 RepID=A0A9W6SIA0_9ACTN|nr:helix-turn-helix transcriptional regulator [Actinorhabdospora filicis]GLZ76467.1 hypothetical protein Afil01_12740 [Actinorhabdospora filicis]